ncbi:MAG TPA: hypothetical protein PLW24_13825 [Burkholderiaceae bacterium]|nr:hypothetical protein [Burkholderiaceae bacterium]HNG80547.1 hypothetical protein [Burkholderiaceae bacterium]
MADDCAPRPERIMLGVLLPESVGTGALHLQQLEMVPQRKMPERQNWT